MSKPKIKHIAIMCRDTEKMAEFYKSVFQMDEAHRAAEVEGRQPAVFLTDGYISLAILPCRLDGEAAAGINHFGFQVENMEEISGQIVAAGIEEPKIRPSNRPYAEFRGCDPEGNLYDLSVHGFQDAETRAEREAKAGKTREPADA